MICEITLTYICPPHQYLSVVGNPDLLVTYDLSYRTLFISERVKDGYHGRCLRQAVSLVHGKGESPVKFVYFRVELRTSNHHGQKPQTHPAVKS